MNALEVKNLAKVYPSFTLKSVSFAVKEGRICGLVGANGAGKSTTLKGIVGLIRTEGTAEIFGCSAESEAAKQLVGYAGGGFRSYPQKRIKSLARAVSLFYPAWDGGRFAQLCRRFGLDSEKKTSELSEGMKVKFALALALSHGARLLILDEPTSGLDPLSREELCDTLLSLVREEGISVLFSTHITSDLDRIADDIVLLSNGEVLVNEPLADLKARYLLVTSPRSDGFAGAVGVKPVKEGFEGLVLRENIPVGAAFREPTLDEIVIHTEYERRGKR